MAEDRWEARWEDDGGALEGKGIVRREKPSGPIVVVALLPFFVLPVVGMAVGRLVGFAGLLGGALLGFTVAIGIAHQFGRRRPR